MKTKLPLLLALNIFITYNVLSQQLVPLTIKVNNVGFKKKAGSQSKQSVTAVYKFYRDTALPANLLSTNGCFSIKTAKDSVFQFADSLPPSANLISDSILINPSVDTVIKVVMENYNSSGGVICTYKKTDEMHAFTTLLLHINALHPGLYGDTAWLRPGNFSACVQVRYGLAGPGPITTSADTIKQNKSTLPYSFKTSVDIKNTDSLKYVWEFTTGDAKNWQLLGDSAKTDITILPEKDIFKSVLKMPAQVKIRFSVQTSQVTSQYVYKTVTFSPPPPLLDTAQLKIAHSCPGRNSGTVSVNNITGTTGNYRYYLRKGKDNSKNCAEDMMKPCTEAIKKALFSDTFFVIENVPSGDYTLIVSNDGFNVGDYYSWVNVRVPQYPVLKISSKKIKPAICSSGNVGSILLTLAANNAPELAVEFLPSNNFDIHLSNDSVFIPKLNAGSYGIKFSDDCNQIDTAYNLIVPANTKNTTANIAVVKKPDTDSVSNGAVTIHIADGPSVFSYRFTKNNLPVIYDSTDKNDIIINNVAVGRYAITLADAVNRTCGGYDTSFVIRHDTDRNIFKNIQYNAFDSAFENLPFNSNYLLVVNKTDYLLRLYKNNLFVAEYPVTFGTGDVSNKQMGGDLKTPAGLYTIISKSADSKLDRFFIFDYPTSDNYATFNQLKAGNLIPEDAFITDRIGLHGTPADAAFMIDQRQNWTNGSISLKNKDIEALYDILPLGTKVLILNR